MGYLAFLLEREEEDSQKLEFLQTIHDESLKLKGLLEKLLDFSAMSEDNLGLQIEAGDLEELATIFHRERLPGVAESLHEFTMEVGGRVPMARYDPQRVRQILDALVDNAIKFTPQGSNLVLRVDAMVTQETKWIRIRLADDGPGILPERLTNIFDSFRQGDGSHTRTVGGMGMGLAYAKQLAESMDGKLLAESEPGQGATFSLLLPTA
jgi:signal transduction histidine kinase